MAFSRAPRWATPGENQGIPERCWPERKMVSGVRAIELQIETFASRFFGALHALPTRSSRLPPYPVGCKFGPPPELDRASTFPQSSARGRLMPELAPNHPSPLRGLPATWDRSDSVGYRNRAGMAMEPLRYS